MIYAYDILVNWSKDRVYDFFEWDKKDYLEHIKKIPLFKVDKTTFMNILRFDCKIDNKIINKIYNLSESYSIKKNKKISYAMVICDEQMSLVIKCDKSGNIKYRSKLLLEEENEIISLIKKIDITKIEYIKSNIINPERFITREENEIRLYLLKEIQDSYDKKNFDKLKYLYTEYTNNMENNIEKIYNNLKYSLENNIDSNHYNLYNLLQLSANKN